ncbi:MAG: hypothetical protein ACK4MY_10870 [Brevundimonas sp.]
MKINGRNAQAGTLVIGVGQTAELDLPWGSFSLVFNPNAQKQNISLNGGSRQILFDATDNALGIGTTLNIPLSNGTNVSLNLAVYSIGDGTAVTRIVHYTVG